jgi:hypothetical protein
MNYQSSLRTLETMWAWEFKQNCFKVQVNSTEPGFSEWKRVEHPSLVMEQSVSGAG